MLGNAPRCATPRLLAPTCTRGQLRRGAKLHRQYASLADLPQPGDQLHGFTVTRKKHVPDLDLTAVELLHDKTGAQYLHVARDDKNNVFSVGFKTNPPDHTGVPHILEHMVLCGSERYPVRDPFFKMMPRSLQNFMNAMTYPDHTVYPFATTNAQDFKNLMSVYLDATLHPLLKAQDFAQEGWRIGPQDVRSTPGDISTSATPEKLVFKGVVYNEMKGSMSSADSLFYTLWQNNIFPSIQNSGGMPQQMTNLTHEGLKSFHAQHYHPSNSKVFTYGDMPLSEHLQEIGAQLDRFEKIDIDLDLKLPVTLGNSHEAVTAQGPTDPLFPTDQQYKSSVSWLMCDTSDVVETFSLSMISSLLLDGFSAPLYQNTIEIGMGAAYSPNTGLDTSGKIAIFSAGLSGLKKAQVDGLEDGIRKTLLAVKRKGFDVQKVNGHLHQIELSLKHRTAHFGMGMMSRLQDGWFNGIDPLVTADPAQTLASFRERLATPGYLESLLDKYWLNRDTFRFVMEPDPNYEAGLLSEEALRLEQKMQEVSNQFPSADAAHKNLAQRELELQTLQETAKNDNIDCLPTLRVTDIPRHSERKQLRFSSIDNTQVQWREAATNGITYLRGIYKINDLPDELRLYLPLFSSAIQRLGTQDLSIEALEDTIKLKTGGIDVGHHSTTSANNIDLFEEGIAFSGHALDRNVPSMYDLLRKIILETNFDSPSAQEKIAELIKSTASSALDDVADSGHAYARRFAEAGISPQSRLNEQISGLTQMKLMMNLAARDKGRLEDVIDRLKTIQSIAIGGGSSLRVALTCGSESSSANEQALQKFLLTIPSGEFEFPARSEMAYERNAKSFFPLPYQVYYSAFARRTVPYTHTDSAPLRILAELLTHKRIHHEIREKGGAYGGSAYAAAVRGVFGFSSYRDPNPANSLKVMNEAGAWAADRKFTKREMEEAKLSIFQGLDAPQSVSSEGMTTFLTGIDDDMRQRHREQLLDVKARDVNEVAQKYLVDDSADTNVALLGKTQDWINAENGWTEMPMDVTPPTDANSEDETDDGYLVI